MSTLYFDLPILSKEFISSAQKQLESIESIHYPPVNVYSSKESTFISIATSGFKKEELFITLDKSILRIEGKKVKAVDEDIKWRTRQISQKDFRREFTLAEFAVVKDAKYEDGLLTVELVVEIPEDKKPKSISIK